MPGPWRGWRSNGTEHAAWTPSSVSVSASLTQRDLIIPRTRIESQAVAAGAGWQEFRVKTKRKEAEGTGSAG